MSDNRYLHVIRQDCPPSTVARTFKIALHIWILMFLFAFLASGCTFTSLRDAVVSGITAHEAPTALSPAPIIHAVYLPFQNGFMVYIEGESCLYAYADQIIRPRVLSEAFGTYLYCLPFGDMPETPASAPADPFGQVWLLYDEVADALGAPTGDPIRYVTATPPPDPVIMGGIFYGGILTLPDGTRLYCGMRAATAGTCQLRAR